MKFFLKLMFVVSFLFLPASLHAEEGENEETANEYIYEVPKPGPMSKTYWALGMLDPDNNKHIDNFLRINECEIYREYIYNEFEWKSVRAAGKDFIKNNKDDFPTRYHITKKLLLGNYDFEREGFNILGQYQTKGAKRFQYIVGDPSYLPCGTIRGSLDGYPMGIEIEISRPLILDFLPMKREEAKKFLEEKSKSLKNETNLTRIENEKYAHRDIYLHLYLNFIATKGKVFRANSVNYITIIAVLEKYEVTSEAYGGDILLSANFMKKKEDGQTNMLKQRFEARKKRLEAEQKLKAEEEKSGDGNAGPESPGAEAGAN